VDSRYDLLRYRGLTACTPNESEVDAALGTHIDDDPDALERAGRLLLRRTGMRAVLITRGSRGMALFQPKQATVHVPIFGADEVADVTGADMPPVVVSMVTYPQVPSKDVLWLPLDLSLPYDAERINPEHTYVVSARVKDAGGTVRFLNLQSVNVLTQGALSRVDVTVDPVQRP